MRALRLLILLVTLALGQSARADLIANWGTVVTPLSTEATFSFARYDITNNFTDQYAFSLEGSSGASYEVTFAFDACRSGCGNPDLSYGIYDANGGLVASAGGTVTLASGSYVFQVKGFGMGSGNSVDYWGNVSFSALAVPSAIVPPAPEPATLLLAGPGQLIVLWAARHRRSAAARPTARSAVVATQGA